MHVTIDGQRHIRAIHRLLRVGHRAGDLLTAVTLLVHLIAVGAGECLVLQLFDAGDPLALGIDAPKQRSHERAVRVQAFIAQLRIDNASQVQLRNLAFDLGRHVFLQYGVLACARQLAAYLRGAHAKQRGEQLGDRGHTCGGQRLAVELLAIRLGRCRTCRRFEGLRRIRIAYDRVALHALGQHHAVRVHDLATLGLQRHLERTALLGGHGQLRAFDELNVHQLAKAAHGQHRHHHRDDDGAAHQLRGAIPFGFQAFHSVAPP